VNNRVCRKLPEKGRGLHQQILDYARSRVWIALHGSMAHRTHRTVGEPDFVILADRGRVVLIEVKRPGAKVSCDQAALHAWAKRLGQTVIWKPSVGKGQPWRVSLVLRRWLQAQAN